MVIKPVLKHFALYSFSSLLLRGISYLSAPISLYYVSPSEFGLLSLLTSFGAICSILFGLGLRQLLVIEFFHKAKDARIRFVAELIFFYCSVGLPILCVLLYNLGWCTYFFFPQHMPTLYLGIVFCNCFLLFFAELLYQLLRFQEKAKQLIIIQLASALICFSVTISGLAFFHMGIGAMLFGQCMSLSFTTALGCFFFIKKGVYRTIQPVKAIHNSLAHLPKSIIFLPGLLFSWIISGADRWILAHFMDLQSVGIYALANTVAQLFYFLILVPMGNAYIPFMLKEFTRNKQHVWHIEKQNRKNMVQAMVICFFLISIGSGLLIVLKPLLPPGYHPALLYIFPLLLSHLFAMGVYFANCLLQFHKCTYFLSFSILVPATINYILNWLCIPLFGIAGCVCATALANAVYFLVTILYNQHILKSYAERQWHKKSSLQKQEAPLIVSYRIYQSKENPPLIQRPHSDIAHGRHLDLHREEVTEQDESQD